MRVQSTPKGQYLRWEKRATSSSELEALKKKEAAAKQQPVKKTDDIKSPQALSPHLHEWYRNQHRDDGQAKQVDPVNSDRWHQRSLDAIASLRSVVDREEAQKLLTKEGAWGTELTYRTIMSFIERRKHERQLAGR